MCNYTWTEKLSSIVYSYRINFVYYLKNNNKVYCIASVVQKQTYRYKKNKINIYNFKKVN